MRIISTGVALPSQAITNVDIAEKVGSLIDPNWIDKNLGIYERRIAASDEWSSDLATDAILSLLDNAGVKPETIDLLILATATPDLQAPATACLVQKKAGLSNAVAFDIGAVCSGFLYALTTAATYLNSGMSKRAVVVGADTFSKIANWESRDCVYFGDGAGAVLLEPNPDGKNMRETFDACLSSNGDGLDAFLVRHGSDFEMDASAVFDAASQAVPLCIETVLKRNNLRPNDIDIVVPHQPSIKLLENVAQISGIPYEKFYLSMRLHANTAAATIGIALHGAFSDRKIRPGNKVLFAAAGAGFTAGAAIYRA